jgi:hypothetical protein
MFTAMRALIALFLFSYPLVGSKNFSFRDRTEDDFFPHRNGKGFDEAAGKIVALMAPFHSFGQNT